MANTNDTIDGLLAEFRGYAAGMPAGYHVTMSWHDFRRMLDRFDAAHKRETVEVSTRAATFAINKTNEEWSQKLGDVAKLREAIKAIGGLCDGLIPTWDGAIGRIKDIIEAALAAPPRNCDRFTSAEEAWDAYDAWVESYRAQGKTEPFNEFGWLFATATEGGANV